MQRTLELLVAPTVGAVLLAAPLAASEDVELRSGVDPIHAWSTTGTNPLSAAPFNPGDFAAAASGPLVQQITAHPYWTAALPGDPLAAWVSPGQGWTGSALYAVEFVVTTPGDPLATFELRWAADDRLGDLPGEPNPPGLYVNGVALSAVFSGPTVPVGGSVPLVEAEASVPVVTGVNTLYVYQREEHGVVSGLLFSARVRVGECGDTAPTCTGQLNSTGATAKLTLHGSRNVLAHDSLLESWDLPDGFGVFFYGQGYSQLPYGNGVLCISPFDPGLRRVADAVGIQGGSCTCPIDFDALPLAARITAGSTWSFQLLYRDVAAGGAGFNLSDALSVTFCD